MGRGLRRGEKEASFIWIFPSRALFRRGLLLKSQCALSLQRASTFNSCLTEESQGGQSYTGQQCHQWKRDDYLTTPRKKATVITNKAEGRHEKNSLSSPSSPPRQPWGVWVERRAVCERSAPSLWSDFHCKFLEPLVSLDGRKTESNMRSEF